MYSTESSILTSVWTTISNILYTTAPEEIAIRKWPYDKSRDKDHWYPGITISRAMENERPGTNERDDVGYGIQVTMVMDNSAYPDELDYFSEWRQKIRKAFIHQRLTGTGTDTIYTCLVEPGPVYKNVPENYDIDTLVIRVMSREART